MSSADENANLGTVMRYEEIGEWNLGTMAVPPPRLLARPDSQDNDCSPVFSMAVFMPVSSLFQVSFPSWFLLPGSEGLL